MEEIKSLDYGPELPKVPARLLMVAGGVSAQQYPDDVLRQGGEPLWDEVWVVNASAAIYRHDVIFALDDLRDVCMPDRIGSGFGTALRLSGKPIVTSRTYPEFPTSRRYPVEKIATFFQTELWSANTCTMMMAYAIAGGVEDLWLYGFDFAYPNVKLREEGGMAAGWLLGWCHAKGIRTHLPEMTALMNVLGRLHTFKCSNRSFWHYYGFKEQPWLGILTQEEKNELAAFPKGSSLSKGAGSGDWGYTQHNDAQDSVQSVFPAGKGSV